MGVEYRLELGASLLGKRSAQAAGCDDYCTLRYDFKPASACRAAQGHLEVQLASQKVGAAAGAAPPPCWASPGPGGLVTVCCCPAEVWNASLAMGH